MPGAKVTQVGDLIARFREHLCMWCKWTCTKNLYL